MSSDFLKLPLTVAAMTSAGLRGCICITRYKPCLRELNLKNL